MDPDARAPGTDQPDDHLVDPDARPSPWRSSATARVLAAAMFGLRDAILRQPQRPVVLAPAPEPAPPRGPLVDFDPDSPGPVRVVLRPRTDGPDTDRASRPAS